MGPSHFRPSQGRICMYQSRLASLPEPEIWSDREYFQCGWYLWCVAYGSELSKLLTHDVLATPSPFSPTRQLRSSQLQRRENGFDRLYKISCTGRRQIQYWCCCSSTGTHYLLDIVWVLTKSGCRWLHPK